MDHRPARGANPEQDLAIIQLRDEFGLTWVQINAVTGIPTSTLQSRYAKATLAPTRRRTATQLSAESAAELYRSGKTIAAIATEQGVSTTTVIRRLRAQGVQPRTKPTLLRLALTDEELRQRHAAGETYKELAATCGVSPTSIWRRVNLRSAASAGIGARWDGGPVGHAQGELVAEASPNFPSQRGWRVGCSCGWTGVRRYRRRLNELAPSQVLEAAAAEWDNHLTAEALLADLAKLVAQSDAIDRRHLIRNDDIERQIAETIQPLRTVATWQQIADRLGITRQGAHDRFHHYLRDSSATDRAGRQLDRGVVTTEGDH